MPHVLARVLVPDEPELLVRRCPDHLSSIGVSVRDTGVKVPLCSSPRPNHRADRSAAGSYLGDEAHLVHVVAAGEEGLAVEELQEDAADGPDVDGGGVVRGVEQELGGAVPPRDHVLRHHVALRRWARQPEVADLEVAVGVQQQVAGLQVPVDYVRRVDVLEPAQYLVQEVLQDDGRHVQR